MGFGLSGGGGGGLGPKTKEQLGEYWSSTDTDIVAVSVASSPGDFAAEIIELDVIPLSKKGEILDNDYLPASSSTDTRTSLESILGSNNITPEAVEGVLSAESLTNQSRINQILSSTKLGSQERANSIQTSYSPDIISIAYNNLSDQQAEAALSEEVLTSERLDLIYESGGLSSGSKAAIFIETGQYSVGDLADGIDEPYSGSWFADTLINILDYQRMADIFDDDAVTDSVFKYIMVADWGEDLSGSWPYEFNSSDSTGYTFRTNVYSLMDNKSKIEQPGIAQIHNEVVSSDRSPFSQYDVAGGTDGVVHFCAADASGEVIYTTVNDSDFSIIHDQLSSDTLSTDDFVASVAGDETTLYAAQGNFGSGKVLEKIEASTGNSQSNTGIGGMDGYCYIGLGGGILATFIQPDSTLEIRDPSDLSVTSSFSYNPTEVRNLTVSEDGTRIYTVDVNTFNSFKVETLDTDGNILSTTEMELEPYGIASSSVGEVSFISDAQEENRFSICPMLT